MRLIGRSCLNTLLHFVNAETRALADSACTLHTIVPARRYVMAASLNNPGLLRLSRAKIERAACRAIACSLEIFLSLLLESFDRCLVRTDDRVLIRLLNSIFRLRLRRLSLRLVKHHRHRTVSTHAKFHRGTPGQVVVRQSLQKGSSLLLRMRVLSSWVTTLRWQGILLIRQEARFHLADAFLVILDLVTVIEALEERTGRHVEVTHLLYLLLLHKVGGGAVVLAPGAVDLRR